MVFGDNVKYNKVTFISNMVHEIRARIAKYFGFPFQDFWKGTGILRTMRVLHGSQFWNDEKMKAYRLRKLQELVQYSYQHVPYYSELFNLNGIVPEDIQSLEDIQKIPILTKELARNNQKKLIAEVDNLKKIKKGKTGGTTGVPLIVLSDRKNRSFTWASYYRWYNWIGISKEDRVLTFWGSRTVLNTSLQNRIIGKVIDFVLNKETINAFQISTKKLPAIYSKIIKYDPVLIKGYLSAIILLAKYMQKENLHVNKSLKAISTTSETLMPNYRKLLEEVFGVPVFDQYGCGEVSAISYECKEHHGLHINEEHVYVEVIDENDKQQFNKPGRLVVTSLDNYIMPFIRYEIGDIATLYTGKCNCGVNSQLMGSIIGRSIDTIKIRDGSLVHGVFFTDILYEVGITTDLISRFQVTQYDDESIDFKIESQSIISENILQRLSTELGKFIDKVRVILVDHIPNEENGKYKYINHEHK